MADYLLHLTSTTTMTRTTARPLLSKRERQILVLVGKGATNQEIAGTLFISFHTVKTHLYNIYQKIAVRNRCQAARWAEEKGLS